VTVSASTHDVFVSYCEIPPLSSPLTIHTICRSV